MLPPGADLEAASGLPRAAVDQMEWNIRQVLVQVRASRGCRNQVCKVGWARRLFRLLGHAAQIDSATHRPPTALPAAPCPPALPQDTAAISTLRCLKLFLERMGAHHLDEAAMAAMAGRASKLVRAATPSCRLAGEPLHC